MVNEVLRCLRDGAQSSSVRAWFATHERSKVSVTI
jgi:hypothetical protein